MSAETIGALNVALTSDPSEFLKGIEAAGQSIIALEKQITHISTVGSAVRAAIVPIGAAIAEAVASEKALAAYAASPLPGAKAYVASIEEAKQALTGLAAAVGEYLAPAAQKTAELVARVAKALTPLVRQFTALTRSAAHFLEVLGGNLVAAFEPIMPTVSRLVHSLTGMFNGPIADWSEAIQRFRRAWNSAWFEILNYSAPILIATAKAVDAAVGAIEQILTRAFGAINAAAGGVVAWLRTRIPGGAAEAASAIAELGQVIRNGIVIGLAVAEYAFAHWEQTATIACAVVASAAQAAWSIVVSVAEQAYANLAAIAAAIPRVFIAGWNWAAEAGAVAAETIGKWFAGIGESIDDSLKPVFKWLAESFPALAQALRGNWEPLGAIFKNLWNSVESSLRAVYSAVANVIGVFSDWLPEIEIVAASLAALFALGAIGWAASFAAAGAVVVAVAAIGYGLYKLYEIGQKYVYPFFVKCFVAIDKFITGVYEANMKRMQGIIDWLKKSYAAFGEWADSVAKRFEPLRNMLGDIADLLGLISEQATYAPGATAQWASAQEQANGGAFGGAAGASAAASSTWVALPGFDLLADELKAASADLPGFSLPDFSGGALGDVAGKLRELLAPTLDDINAAIKPFVDAVVAGLPTLSATPAAIEAQGATHRRADAALKGTQEAYRAIYEATAPEKDSKQLAEARRQTKLQGQIAAGVKQKPRVAHFA